MRSDTVSLRAHKLVTIMQRAAARSTWPWLIFKTQYTTICVTANLPLGFREMHNRTVLAHVHFLNG